MISGPALRYHGSVTEFRRALRKHRMAVAATSKDGVLGDDRGRRRFQRYLRQAEMASIRAEILGRVGARNGGDAA